MDVNLNEKLVNEAQSTLKDAEKELGKYVREIEHAINLIKGAAGYDLVEKEGGEIDASLLSNFENYETNINNINNEITEKKENINNYSANNNNEEEILKTENKSFFGSIVNGFKSVLKAGAKAVTGAVSAIGSFISGLFSPKKAAEETGADVVQNKENQDDIKSDEILKRLPHTDSDTTEVITTPPTSSLDMNTENKSVNVANVNKNSRVGQAIDKYQDEIKNADFATVNDRIFATTTYEKINGKTVEVTHVVINDGSQINGAPANGAYASGLETASSASKRLNSKILINGSHFNYSDGSEDLKGANNIVIVNGKVVKDGVSGGQELLIDNSGKVFNVAGKSAQELVNQGVKYSFACHSTQVIENGDTSPSYRETNNYKRTVLGMTQPGEYYIVTDNTYDNRLSDTAEYLKNKGCTNAYSLDQGGSVTLTRNTQVINNPTEGERAVGDFLYFI